MASQVTTRGQITIERTAREALSVQPGMTAVQIVVGDHLEVYFIPAPHRRSLFGRLKPKGTVREADWDAIRDRAQEAIAAEANAKR
jgi:bifunctional DNA-binding transcriptional regulator/antitoxin component of YhaV-PrlF toxin-antitoxin module